MSIEQSGVTCWSVGHIPIWAPVSLYFWGYRCVRCGQVLRGERHD